MELFKELSHINQALIAGIFTWLLTSLGASVVFFSRSVNQRMLDTMLAFAGGVMTAASYWSLLAPAITMAEEFSYPSWIPATTGFLLGAGFLWVLDRFMPHLHIGFDMKDAEGPKTRMKKTALLVMAITLHNIPEGLAVGVAFGAVASGSGSASLAGAVALALGIGLQNFPEGIAVSVPLRREGLTRAKSFFYGQLSGLVEPLSAVLGAAAVMLVKPLLPYALAFAAGAMMFVVVEEAVPESQHHGNIDLATMGFMLGFAVMMTLDVALG